MFKWISIFLRITRPSNDLDIFLFAYIQPLFDRDLELSRGSADIVQKNNRIIIIEGNYLLLNYTPWNLLKKYIDIFVFLDVEKEILRERSQKRWKYYGLSKKEILKKVKNDMNSVEIVLQNSNKANIVIEN